jgi:hypothetical protein
MIWLLHDPSLFLSLPACPSRNYLRDRVEGLREKPNHTTREKAWSSRDHSILCGGWRYIFIKIHNASLSYLLPKLSQRSSFGSEMINKIREKNSERIWKGSGEKSHFE